MCANKVYIHSLSIILQYYTENNTKGNTIHHYKVTVVVLLNKCFKAQLHYSDSETGNHTGHIIIIKRLCFRHSVVMKTLEVEALPICKASHLQIRGLNVKSHHSKTDTQKAFKLDFIGLKQLSSLQIIYCQHVINRFFYQ